jgi:translation elongation factor EF-Ts
MGYEIGNCIGDFVNRNDYFELFRKRLIDTARQAISILREAGIKLN